MANLRVIIFLIFFLFQVQKGITTRGETTTVKTNTSESSVTWGNTSSQDAGSQQTTRIPGVPWLTVWQPESQRQPYCSHVLETKVSSIPSVTDTFTIVPSTGSKNTTFETVTSQKNETTVNTTTATQSTFISVATTRLATFSMMSISKAELTDPASSLQPTLTTSANGSSPLSVLAFAVIILILILVIVVVILVSVISLRFKCCDVQDASIDSRKARNAAPSESSQANGEKESITLVSMRTLSTETGPEPLMQRSLQNDAIEAGETDKNFQQINNTKLVSRN
ncbi:endothelial cell-specific chemotaxis regulator isoform X2 [Chiloscyllium plagiosum]|uniref:endothelial cell-specific chemotaxis regulator isoform X2 n=1 Tax=Chiloscyllium plagiosum TaxID=36176 RepID=UPI001CB81F6C|nr:endothelial cell-specific chemotaxis regulator isoform X2 [Chiloscyllium plagiosum]